MTAFNLLLLLALAEGPVPEVSTSAALRIAACGPSEGDRAAINSLMRGATYDHLGGGFNDWPGGPKTLETNAWYLNSLISTYESKPDLFLRNVALDTVAFVLRDLKNAAGAFFTSQGDARSENYFAFSEQEIRVALGPDKSREFFEHFGLTSGGFPRLTGSPFAGLADTRQTLWLRRLRRVRLPLDDTIDPGANGAWIGALARAAVALQRHDFTEAAQSAARAVAQSPMGPGSAGAAFGFTALERFDPARSTPEAASSALDRAIEVSPSASASELAVLAWSLADTMRVHPSETRGRQLSRVVRQLVSRFPNTDAGAAAACVAATARAKVPSEGSRPFSPGP